MKERSLRLKNRGLEVFYEQGAMDDILSPLREKPPKAGSPPQAWSGTVDGPSENW